jgi:cell division protease FtsH
MVGLWGMSEVIGPLAVIPENGQPTLPGVPEVSPETAKLVDDEVKRLVGEAHDDVRELLSDNRDRLDALAEALLEHETLDTADAYAAAGIPRGEREAASRA